MQEKRLASRVVQRLAALNAAMLGIAANARREQVTNGSANCKTHFSAAGAGWETIAPTSALVDDIDPVQLLWETGWSHEGTRSRTCGGVGAVNANGLCDRCRDGADAGLLRQLCSPCFFGQQPLFSARVPTDH